MSANPLRPFTKIHVKDSDLNRVQQNVKDALDSLTGNANLQSVAANGSGSSSTDGQYDIQLAPGLNSNVTTNGLSVVRIGGPTAAYSIDGLKVLPAPGTSVTFINTAAFALTLVGTGSVSAFPLDTQSFGGPIVLQAKTGTFTVVGDQTAKKCVVRSVGLHRPQRVNVCDYGADPTASGGSDAAVARAVAVATATHLPLYFPAGDYILGSSLSLPAAMCVIGENHLQTVLEFPNATDGIVWGGAAGAQDTAGHIEGLRIYASHGTGLDGLRVQNATGPTVERVTVAGFSRRGIAFVDTILGKAIDYSVAACGGPNYAAFEVDSAKVNGVGTAGGSTTFTSINGNISNLNSNAVAGVRVDRTEGATFLGGTIESTSGTVLCQVGCKAETVSGVKNFILDGGIDLETSTAFPGVTTTTAAGSNGVALPTGTVHATATTNYPATGGSFLITTSAGIQTVYYTGISGNDFTGCTGGTGTMATGNTIQPNGRLIEFGYGLSNTSADNRVSSSAIRTCTILNDDTLNGLQFAIKAKYTTGLDTRGAHLAALAGSSGLANIWGEGTTNVGMTTGTNTLTNTSPYVVINGVTDPTAVPSAPWSDSLSVGGPVNLGVVEFTPVNGANALTAIQSNASFLNLLAGATAAFTVSSARLISNTSFLFVRNNTTQTATIAYASGGTVNVATLTSAVIFSNGSNLVILMNGT